MKGCAVMAVGIWVGAIQIAEIRNNANLMQGKQVQNAWSMIAKSNFAIGQVNGNFDIVPSGVDIVNDCDVIDMNIPNAAGQSPVLGNNLEVM